jgi:restriction system protein
LEAGETALLTVIKAISSEGFERLCQRLLREHGFQNVRVTGRSGDGGIDGEGILEINPLLSLRCYFNASVIKDQLAQARSGIFEEPLLGRLIRVFC